MSLRRLAPLSIALVFITILAFLGWSRAHPMFIYNETSSLPVGLYRIHDSKFSYGDIVAFPIPDKLVGLVNERQWIPDYFTLIKPVAAMAGDTVCFNNGSIFVNGTSFGDVSRHDSQGKPMPLLAGCHHVDYGDIWVLIKGESLSLDSRYYGPISTHNVYGKATHIL